MTGRRSRARALVVLAAVAGLVLVGGPAAGDFLSGLADRDSASGAADSTPTAGRSDATTDGRAGAGTDGTGTADDAPAGDAETRTPGSDSRYDFAIQRVESCGTTCRNVTARLSNEGSEPREDVRVTTAIYAEDDLLWRGNETVSRLAGGETYTSTRQVTLGLGEAATIQGNDGYVTIVTLVRSPDGVVRFEDRRQVA
ncbi:hypothetical protein [Halorussus halobius]|uniref:hypothetical protein n=1 Tax=Halorussus halobius TaxID=1710537 RepID=UPI0010920615|nr:hypothetical protein [Halorussus halobius]